MRLGFVLVPTRENLGDNIKIVSIFEKLLGINIFNEAGTIFYRGALEHQVARNALRGSTHMLVLDEYAAEHVTFDMLSKSLTTLVQEPTVSSVGFTLDRKYNQVIRSGFILNSCAIWNVSDLMHVGAFTRQAPDEISVLAELYKLNKKTRIVRLENGPSSGLSCTELRIKISSKWTELRNSLEKHNREVGGQAVRQIDIMDMCLEIRLSEAC